MLDSNPSTEEVKNNISAFEELSWAIDNFKNQFKLIVVNCNYAKLFQSVIEELRATLPNLKEITLKRDDIQLYAKVAKEFNSEKRISCISVNGIIFLDDIDDLLISMNQVREEFKKSIRCPMLLWVNDEGLKKIIRKAPDFESWATHIRFSMSERALIQLIKQTTDEVFEKVLESGAGGLLRNINSVLHLQLGSPKRIELQHARNDLSQLMTLDPELEASLEFVFALAIGISSEKAKEHLEKSIKIWAQVNNPTRLGCVLFYLGRWWRTYAFMNRAEDQKACQKARDLFQDSLNIFEQCNHSDLVAKFVNALGEVLHRLKDWSQLKKIAVKAIALHQSFNDLFRLARAYGFLAEFFIYRKEYSEAEYYSREALRIFSQAELAQSTSDLAGFDSTTLDWENSYHRGWYLLSLARSQKQLGYKAESLATLKTAKVQTRPHYDPELYIQILEELRIQHYSHKEYKEAFSLKQLQYSLEQQYGFRAFVGTGRLQPEQKVTNPLLPLTQELNMVAEEIVYSKRLEDIEKLIERVGRYDHKLTILYGESGVGKSSIFQAGFIPAIKSRLIGTRNITAVLMQKGYANWIQEFGDCLNDSIKDIDKTFKAPRFWTPDEILKQLRENSNHRKRNLFTVIILDEFEDFFFSHETQKSRIKFYSFLKCCLEIENVKVIISLREDFIYHLLEIDRLVDLDVINNNILDKSILYFLPNLSPEISVNVIKSLTGSVQFPLEDQLIDRLVKDLSLATGSVNLIELQIVGKQLETERVTKLCDYLKLGCKEKLIEQYLEGVIEDCGIENIKFVRKLLYFLTDENNVSSIKTKAELTLNLSASSEQLELILTILIRSGVIREIQQNSTKHYQLAHDYLVNLIRQQLQPKIVEELELTKRELKSALHKTEVAEIKTLNLLSEALWSSNDQIGALRASLKAGNKLYLTSVSPEVEAQTINILGRAVHRIQEKNRFQGHSDVIFSTRFSPNGQLIASASADCTIKLWQLNGTELQTFYGHSAEVNGVRFSPDGQHIASASADGTLKLWDLEGRNLQTFTGHDGYVNNLCFNPEGTILVSAGSDATVILWNLTGEEFKRVHIENSCVNSVCFHPHGRVFASAGSDGVIRLWDLNGRELQIFDGHDAEINSVCFNPSGEILASAGADSMIHIWDMSGKKVNSFKKHLSHVNNICFSSDGKKIASSSADGTIRIWSLFGKELHVFRVLNGGDITYVSFSPDGEQVVASSTDFMLRIWKLVIEQLQTFPVHSEWIKAACFSPDSQTLAVASSTGLIELWSVDGSPLHTFKGHSSEVNSICFSPEGSKIVSASADHTVVVWEIDNTLDTFDTQRLAHFVGHNTWVTSVCFSPDGEIIASASADGKICLWSVTDYSKAQVVIQDDRAIKSICFSPDGNKIASAGANRKIKIWSINGRKLKSLKGHSSCITCICFSPSGEIIASASLDGKIKFWNVEGEEIQTLTGHSNAIYSMYFAANEQEITSASVDGTIRKWNITSGKELNTLLGYSNLDRCICLSPDGKMIVSLSDDDTLTLWKSNLEFDLRDLIERGRRWVQDYLVNNSNSNGNRSLLGHRILDHPSWP